MAPRRRRSPGSVLLWSHQVAPRHDREPVPRHRKAPGQDKAQSSAACIDGAAHVSLTIRYGIMGAAIAATLPSVLIVVLTLREAGKIIGENIRYIAGNFVPAIIGSLIMALSIWGWQEFAVGFSPVIRLAVSILMGAAVYVGYLWWMNREIFYEVKGLVGRK